MKIISGNPCFGGHTSTIDYDIPCPSIEQFSYTAAMGVLRTAVATSHARQRRLHKEQPRTYSLSWVLKTEDLYTWERFAQQHGYNWHFLPMVTGQVPKWFPVEHPIRYIDDFQVQLLQENLWEVTVTAEQYKLNPDCTFELLCDELFECLPVSFQTVAADFAGMVAAVGADTVWGRTNG